MSVSLVFLCAQTVWSPIAGAAEQHRKGLGEIKYKSESVSLINVFLASNVADVIAIKQLCQSLENLKVCIQS